MDQLCTPEPKWVLDRSGSGQGQLFWRRESGTTRSRVKFRFDVEVVEFKRQDYEFFEPELQKQSEQLADADRVILGISCLICVAITIILPWYIIIGA